MIPCRASCFIVLMNVVKKMCTSSIAPSMYLSSSTFTGPTSLSMCGRSPSCTACETTFAPSRLQEAHAPVADRA